MGNRANRKRAQELLRSWGFKGRLWTGKMPWREKNLVAECVTRTFKLKVGDIVNDCDGFNHVIRGLSNNKDHLTPLDPQIDFLRDNHTSGVSVAPWNIPQYLFEDGYLSCGCPTGCEPAMSREDIEEYFLSMTDEYIAEEKRRGWWNANAQKRVDAVRAGRHLCDERGILYPEYARRFESEESESG